MKRYIQGHFGIGALLAIGGMLASCTTGDDLANDGPAHSSAAVSFSVSGCTKRRT